MRCNEKNEIKPWLVKEWCIPKAGAEFVAKMEDVLDVYETPYDPLLPVVCVDEMNKQLLEERRIPCAPGDPEKVDSEYKRAGIADVFMAFEPLAGKRVTQVTQTRTAIDFAEFVKPYLTSTIRKPSEFDWLWTISTRIQPHLYTRLLNPPKPAG